MMYNKMVHEYFFAPQHIGALDLNQPSVAYYKKQQTRESIEFYISCDEQIIVKARFKTNGGPYLIAGLEWLCRQILGKKLDYLPEISYQSLVQELDIPLNQYPVALHVIEVFQKIVQIMKNQYELR